MSKKNFSMDHVQAVLNLAPSELQKLIKKYSHQLNLVRKLGEDGIAQVFLDEKSLQKLLFITRLNKCSEAADNDFAFASPRFPSGSDKKEEDTDGFLSTVKQVFSQVSEEAGSLKQNLDQLLIKYDHLIKELNLTRAKNILLEREISTLRNREAHLMGQLRQSAEVFDEELDYSEIN